MREEVSESFEAFVASHTETWEELVDIWLFQRRTLMSTGKQPEKSPFFAMFQRDSGLIREKKTAQTVKKRRKLKNSMLNCRHCDESFTSKISFRIHQQRHLEEARRNGAIIGER